MGGITRTFGQNPRTRLIEALIRLGPREVSRGELASEAGLWRGSTNRIIAALERDGLVTRVKSGNRPIFRARVESPVFDLLAEIASALDYLQLSEPSEPEARVALSAVSEWIGTIASRVGNSALTSYGEQRGSVPDVPGYGLPRIEFQPPSRVGRPASFILNSQGATIASAGISGSA